MRSAAASPAGWPAMPGPDGTDQTSSGRRAIGDGARGGRDHAGRGGGVHAAGPVRRHRCAGRPGSGADARRGAGGAAGADAVPGGDRDRVCTSLDDLGRELARLRRLAADAAASLGCRLVASGIAPYRAPGLAAITDQPRYRDLARRYGPRAAAVGSTCGCHVHVGVPSRDLGVQVLARLRPWLAPLLAITVNSPSRAAAARPGRARGTGPGHAGRPRGRPRCGRTPPPTTRRSAASSSRAPRSTSGASTSSRGCPRVTPRWRSGSPTPASTPAPRCCWPG